MTRVILSAALAAAALLGAPAASADEEVCLDTRQLVDFRAPYFDGCAAVYEDQHYGGLCAKVYGDFNGQHRRFGCVE